MRILIGEISSYKAIVIAKYIRKQYPNVELYGYDSKLFLRHFHTRYIDRYIALPKVKKTQYVEQLAICAEQVQADIVIPVHSDYISDILAHKQLFGKSLDYMGRYEDYLCLHEKDCLMAIAKEVGVRIPYNFASISKAQVPFVVKPNDKSSAKGVRYCFTETDRKYMPKSVEHAVCQEYIYGTGCGYEVYCKEGKIVTEYGHIRLAEYPVTGGSSVWRKGYMHPDMRKSAETILKRIPWTGFAMFEFKVTPQGELVLIEVNPRIWGSINQALQDGVDFFADMMGKETQNDELKGVYTCLSPQIYLALLGYAIRGKWKVVCDYWHYRKQTQADVRLSEDWRGVMSMIIRKLL